MIPLPSPIPEFYPVSSTLTVVNIYSWQDTGTGMVLQSLTSLQLCLKL